MVSWQNYVQGRIGHDIAILNNIASCKKEWILHQFKANDTQIQLLTVGIVSQTELRMERQLDFKVLLKDIDNCLEVSWGQLRVIVYFINCKEHYFRTRLKGLKYPQTIVNFFTFLRGKFCCILRQRIRLTVFSSVPPITFTKEFL